MSINLGQRIEIIRLGIAEIEKAFASDPVFRDSMRYENVIAEE